MHMVVCGVRIVYLGNNNLLASSIYNSYCRGAPLTSTIWILDPRYRLPNIPVCVIAHHGGTLESEVN